MDQLNEKTISVVVELEYKLMNVSTIEQADQEELQRMLEKFSKVFFSDINLYSNSGQLIATSRREIFIKGLLSENINPMAYEELFVKNKLNYITTEHIGNAYYFSSYVPLNLNGFQSAGVVNLPYFAKQSEVARAYYLMLFTFINMFVMLGIAGTFLALLLSRVLTRPLLLLQESLRGLQFDQENERLQWDKNDEIGQLISEYNRMVEKLEQSAELLKHSERESAWREVAQQIAHEIKNPLTPMKLNVQHLEKAYEANDPDLRNRIRNISESLISQIDSLNQVAEMFSNFAKTNAGNLEEVDLSKVIDAAASLFRGQQNLTIKVKQGNGKDTYLTLGIEKDLLRVFNNLIKNAIQSMEDQQKKEIEIQIDRKEGFIVVRVSDQGRGIPEDARQNIFKPYFTTKSGGTGLGLAITRNIMTEIGGEISFENRPEGGTTFILFFRQLS
jgi:nitrogen fixation/metabolism regulation signal transduction histidine kinase